MEGGGVENDKFEVIVKSGEGYPLSQAYQHDAGFDIRSSEDKTIPVYDRRWVQTSLRIKIQVYNLINIKILKY